tara:strand:+ start:162 stop:506 length:345 start_codon:yes stop_codon:yes gene_type:complete
MTKKSKGVSEYDAAKSALEKAKNIKKRAEIKGGDLMTGLKHHPLNPLRIAADIKETNLPLGPYESNLKKTKEKYKDKFPELVKNYKKGGRVTGGRVAKGCGAVMSDRRKKTKYF